jgi:hypothetical protein
MEQVLYELHFDFLSDGLWLCLFLFAGLVLLLEFILNKRKRKESAGIFLVVFIIVMSFGFVNTSIQIKNYKSLKSRYESKDFLSVEGYVEDFIAGTPDGHHAETFEINGVKFSYAMSSTILGYHRPQYRNGVVKEGQYLHIDYVEKISFDDEITRIILYIAEVNSEN